MKTYDIILADPPWNFKTYGESDANLPQSHYPTMSIEYIAALPVKELTAVNCALFFWVVEFCKIRDLDKREQHWIQQLKPEYNIITNISEWNYVKSKREVFYDDEDRDVRRPEWHKWVYGGHRKTSK